MKNFKTFSLAITMLFCVVAFAQERTITGVVSDGIQPLPGAYVVKKGTSQGAQTDNDGKYSIKSKAGDILVYSCVGYENYELKIGDKISHYNISLKNNINLLQETYIDSIPKLRKKDEMSIKYFRIKK